MDSKEEIYSSIANILITFADNSNEASQKRLAQFLVEMRLSDCFTIYLDGEKPSLKNNKTLKDLIGSLIRRLSENNNPSSRKTQKEEIHLYLKNGEKNIKKEFNKFIINKLNILYDAV
jgi:hypothetical protein